ncbi:MAG: nucleoside monophosphate kinase [Rickettsiales bacterium]|nr:nucleoside monophosphate kinase [Rickettsiales bacterium]
MEDKYFAFIGPIAAGKGTQAEIISEKYGMIHLSVGHILRDAVNSGTELGMKVKNIIDNGFLVPDVVANEVVKSTFGEIDLSKGFILDGYPRTINQVYALEDMLDSFRIKLSKVVLIDISEEETIRRISGRFSCSTCGQHYHDSLMPTKVRGVCDVCGGTKFKRRTDDKPEIVKNRLKLYEAEAAPIIGFYRERGLLVEIDATGLSVHETSQKIGEAIF